MKKIILSILLAAFTLSVYSQNLYPSIVEYPVTGLQKIMAENPYVVQQVKDSFGDWLNSAKYFWEPAALPGYKKYDGQFYWMDNAWKEVFAATDSFVLNPDNKIAMAFEKLVYDYPGYSRKEKYRYTYTYNTDKTINTLKMEQAVNINSNNYSAYNFMKIAYDNTGKRIYDSIRYYPQGGTTQFVRYQYNPSNQVIAEYGVNVSTGDTTSRTLYTYEGNLLKTIYSEGFDETTDDWTMQNADSMEINNGKITNRIRYGLFVNGGEVSIRPSTNESYTYNTDGSLHIIITKRWVDIEWLDVSKLEMLYDNTGKPMLAPVYNAIEGGFETDHAMQYVFNFLSGVNDLKQTAGINNIYPNPASEKLNVTLSNTNKTTYSIYDLAGKLIEKGNTTSETFYVDLQKYTNGIYYLNIASGDHSTTRKFIVAK